MNYANRHFVNDPLRVDFRPLNYPVPSRDPAPSQCDFSQSDTSRWIYSNEIFPIVCLVKRNIPYGDDCQIKVLFPIENVPKRTFTNASWIFHILIVFLPPPHF